MTRFSIGTRHLLHYGVGALALLLTVQAQADGMVPNTSVVIVNEADGEASVSVTNTDANLALMHVTLEDIDEDREPLVFVTPPLARVEAGKTQLVRFILQTEKPLLTQRLKRVIFEGIPQGKPAARGRAGTGRRNRAPEPASDPSSQRPGAQPHTLDRPAMVAAGRSTERAQRHALRRASGPGSAIVAFGGPCDATENLRVAR